MKLKVIGITWDKEQDGEMMEVELPSECELEETNTWFDLEQVLDRVSDQHGFCVINIEKIIITF